MSSFACIIICCINLHNFKNILWSWIVVVSGKIAFTYIAFFQVRRLDQRPLNCIYSSTHLCTQWWWQKMILIVKTTEKLAPQNETAPECKLTCRYSRLYSTFFISVLHVDVRLNCKHPFWSKFLVCIQWHTVPL